VPLPDESVDLVVAGQAFHWFRRELALPEIARVLRPGGRMALFYNAREDAVPWVAALSEVIGETGDHVSESRELIPMDFGPLFEPDGMLRAEHEQELDVAGLVDLVGSRSYVIRMPAEQRSALLDRVAGLAGTHPMLIGRQHFSMPYVTTCERYLLRS
jgi:SAM-dependent methyltransferase